MSWQESSVGMFLAASDGDIERMKHLAERGVSLDTVHGQGYQGLTVFCTILQWAAIWGRFEVAEYLVLNNCDINRKDDEGRTAVLMAAENLRTNIVRLLVNSGAQLDGYTGLYKFTLLHHVCFYGWTEIAQIILEKGAVDVNAKSSDMRTPLMLAVQNGNESIAKLLIEAGAEFNSCDNEMKNILHYTCSTVCCSKEGLAKIVNCIVERGETDLNAKSINGWTPLLYAVNTKKEDIAEILIQAGAVANADPLPTTQLSVLHNCIWMGWTKLVSLIIEKWGCDLNPTSGHIPLKLACVSRNIGTIMLLIKTGADVNFKNDSNETTLHYLVVQRDFELIRLLVTHGAYFRTEEVELLRHDSELRELIINDAQLCAHNIINKFNSCHLPDVYSVPVFREALPQIETVTINNDKSTAAQEIRRYMDSKIQTKRNAFKGHLIVLKLICVKWLIKYQATL